MKQPTKYETEVKPRIGEIAEMAVNGLTYREIANKLGISLATLGTYKSKHKELREALNRSS